MMNWKDLEGRHSDVIEIQSQNLRGRTEETMKPLNQDNRCFGRDSNYVVPQ
jgi:hypothetical protein